MEAMKMKIFVVLMVVLMAFSAMQKAAAADEPAPSPASDATIFVPTFLASLVALAFGTKLKAFVGRMVMSCSLADSIGVYVVIVEESNGLAMKWEPRSFRNCIATEICISDALIPWANVSQNLAGTPPFGMLNGLENIAYCPDVP
ncbi:hypothetical protein POTOM_003594 [Populus tomentosa]|uniref:Uncharacterized protein n=1 Tax=Populus tomentosa TaxID=118781 RepID=A0A8X8ADT5_POPTO|nr:hypothetical protein POTOM_003594 [Populus tomentosa]